MENAAEIEKAKGKRTTAKGRFTRKKNFLIKSIDNNQGVEIVETNYAKLAEAYDELEGKHEAYIELLPDDQSEEAEVWMTEVQEKFNEATNRKIKYVEQITVKERSTRAYAERQEYINKARTRQKTARAVFEASYKSISHALQSKEIPNFALRDLQTQIEEEFLECKRSNTELLQLLTQDSAEAEINWIATIQTCYHEIKEKIALSYTDVEEAKETKRESTTSASFLQLEKVRMPHFDGELRKYPQFKRDFQKQVMTQIRKGDAAYVLRTCLKGEPARLVNCVDDDIDEMWHRLDDKYGDPAKVADVIIDEIKRFRMLREGEDKRFIEFVTLIEDGYRNLKGLGLETEITTTSSVSVIEKALPSDIKRKWSERVSSRDSLVDKSNKFPSLLDFLQSQRDAIEYESATLCAGSSNQYHKGAAHYSEGITVGKDESTKEPRPKCLIHENGKHWTSNCRLYQAKTVDEKRDFLREKQACWACLKPGHRQRTCRIKRDCGVNGCTRKHHPSIHENDESTPQQASASANVCSDSNVDTCLLQVQRVKTRKGTANVMWDNAASLCFITNAKAKQEKLSGVKVNLSIVKIGGQNEEIETMKYKLPLLDKRGQAVEFEVYGINKITSDIEHVNVESIAHLFRNVSKDEIARPAGPVVVLIGYEYAAFHPEREQNNGHLVLLKNRFGRCVGGTHPLLKETCMTHNLGNARVHFVGKVNVEDFYTIEALGVQCKPKCGGCKCRKCSLGAKDYTIQEERELELIERNLSFNSEDNSWTAEYPWIKDPHKLPNNHKVAMAKLAATERRLRKNADHAKVYDEQIKDMVARNVARKLSEEELTNYTGPTHYIAHHEVLKPESKSTPVRIVFNSSANYMGHVLNEYWAKGPDLLNNLLGVLIRFRENRVAFMGDIRKMYHTVKTSELDQHTHRFLWRDMDSTREPDTYIIQRVSFGDKPSGTIATVALRKTAEMMRKNYLEAADIIQTNTYMDDIIESKDNIALARDLSQDIEKAIIKGGFQVKEWIFSGDINKQEETIMVQTPHTSTEKILGIKWNPCEDQLCFEVKIKFSPKGKRHALQTNNVTTDFPPQQLTKRMILSQINSIYDPLGLAGPFTVRAKILMRHLWGSEQKLDWDDPIPEENRENWITFFKDLKDMDQVRFMKCVKPSDAV